MAAITLAIALVALAPWLVVAWWLLRRRRAVGLAVRRVIQFTSMLAEYARDEPTEQEADRADQYPR